MSTGPSPVKCDCLNQCGDDPWLKDGRATPCPDLIRREQEAAAAIAAAQAQRDDAARFRAMRREAKVVMKQGYWCVTWCEPAAEPPVSGIPITDNVNAAVDRLREFHSEVDRREHSRTSQPTKPCREQA